MHKMIIATPRMVGTAHLWRRSGRAVGDAHPTVDPGQQLWRQISPIRYTSGMSTTLELTATAPATRVRFKVVGFAVTLAMVTYLDRICIGNLAGPIRRDLSLNESQMNWVFSIFAIAYAVFEL